MTSTRITWIISGIVALCILTAFYYYHYNSEKKFSLEEIAKTIDTEIYYRHPPVHVSFGDGFYISDIYKNVIVNRWIGKDPDEIRLDRSKDLLGYPYQYSVVSGIKYDVNYPSLKDSVYWMSKNPNLSSFASDFETALNMLLIEEDSHNNIIHGLGFMSLSEPSYENDDCYLDPYLFPSDSSVWSADKVNYLFQVPETEYYFILRFTRDQDRSLETVKVFPWWKDKVRSHGL